MPFLPNVYAGYVQYFTISTIIWWLGAVIVIRSIIGFLLAKMYNIIARKTGRLFSFSKITVQNGPAHPFEDHVFREISGLFGSGKEREPKTRIPAR